METNKSIIIYQFGVSDEIRSKIQKKLHSDFVKGLQLNSIYNEFEFSLQAKDVVFMPEISNEEIMNVIKIWPYQTRFSRWDNNNEKRILIAEK